MGRNIVSLGKLIGNNGQACFRFSDYR